MGHGATLSRIATAAAAVTLLAGCVLAPKGTDAEKQRLADAGEPYEQAFDTRTLPELPPQPTWQQVLHRAFLANGDLEAAYFEWKAAMARIPQEASWPNTMLAPSFSYMFGGESMKAWDRTTLTAQFDPGNSLELPVKTAKRGEIALAEARAAAARFAAAKFNLQRQVLSSYIDIALMQERTRIARENADLLRMLTETAEARVRAGANQQDLLRAQTQWRLAENEAESMAAELAAMKAMLNGMLARDPSAPLDLPPGLPEPRPLPADDATLIAAATDANPQLVELAHQVQGRENALELARMAHLPDINPMASVTGSMTRMVGAMVMLPTNLPEIRGMIDEQRAMLRASQAMVRQGRHDRAAQFVAALYAMRNAERQAALFEQAILPRAEQVLSSARQTYTTGAGSFADLIDAQRTLLDVRLLIVESKAEREKRLAEIEALAGIDVETLTGEALRLGANGQLHQTPAADTN